MPRKVDDQRARRRRHDAAVVALIIARAAGLPCPANPWRAEMLLVAATVTAGAPALTVQLRLAVSKPRRALLTLEA